MCHWAQQHLWYDRQHQWTERANKVVTLWSFTDFWDIPQVVFLSIDAQLDLSLLLSVSVKSISRVFCQLCWYNGWISPVLQRTNSWVYVLALDGHWTIRPTQAYWTESGPWEVLGPVFIVQPQYCQEHKICRSSISKFHIYLVINFFNFMSQNVTIIQMSQTKCPFA